ncbi:hypothetical protein RDWZM_005481 [Blomia tropicalis]|uniref:Uncharacterized protein n=1 Tax=Blomia tropicalis TaxID=40697 RepID=A0A9Q0RMD6_BLOTA|nr:hypothetical protein RDWZM_005481 [Blomia tropicalis]
MILNDTNNTETSISNSSQPSTTPFSKNNHFGVIIPAMIIALLLIITVIMIVYNRMAPKTVTTVANDPPVQAAVVPKQPEEQINLILCNSDNINFEYKLILRAGSASPDFDMNRAFIDFEFLGPNDEIIGVPVRFKCSLLPNYQCGEMHYLVGRLTALPPVTGIRAYHSEHAGTIFFYDYKIIDLMNDVIIEDMFIMDHITNKHQIFRGFQSSKIEEPKIEPMADQQVNKKNETNSNLNEWTFIELLIIFIHQAKKTSKLWEYSGLSFLGSLISFTKSLYWYSSFLNTTIIVIGTWFLYEEYRWKIEHPTPPLNENSIKSGTNGLGKVLNKSNEDRNLSVRVMYASASDINRNENKTVYLTHSTSTNALDNSKLLVPNPDFQLTAAPTISPKLKNPIKGNSSGSVTRNKQKHTTGKNARNVSGTSNTSNKLKRQTSSKTTSKTSQKKRKRPTPNSNDKKQKC